MTRQSLVRALLSWGAALVVASMVVHASARIEPCPLPSRGAQLWALDALDAAIAGRTAPTHPADAQRYRAAGPIVAYAWHGGVPVGRFVGPSSLTETISRATRAFAADSFLRSLDHVETTLAITRGRAPLVRTLALPFADGLAFVPLRDGVAVHAGGRVALATPDELLADGTYDRGTRTPIPELTLGADTPALVARLARDLGRSPRELSAIERLRVDTVSRTPYPRARRVDVASLVAAATVGARFLLRHQAPDGRFAYIYDGRSGRVLDDGYSVPRHAGATYFLALLAHEESLPDVATGARSGLAWLMAHTATCGAPDRTCVVAEDGSVDVGSSALAAVAAATYLDIARDPAVHDFLAGLAAFLRRQQRADGELMHVYDRQHDRPVDVQFLYYSGEGALALALAGRALGDARDTRAATRVLAHLTGDAWSFFGSRYYYGEEHWTCSAAAALRESADTRAALDFCRRWAEWNRQLQYSRGESPWPIDGMYGAGNVVLPRLTPVGSRTEAFISTYELAAKNGVRDDALRPEIERGLAALLRYQWDPGPTWLLADPIGARGGIPGSPADLAVRDDYLQHAGSAMVRWIAVLRHGARAWASP